MSLHMVYAHKRNVKRKCRRFCRIKSYQKRAHKTGAVRGSYRVYIFIPHACLFYAVFQN